MKSRSRPKRGGRTIATRKWKSHYRGGGAPGLRPPDIPRHVKPVVGGGTDAGGTADPAQAAVSVEQVPLGRRERCGRQEPDATRDVPVRPVGAGQRGWHGLAGRRERGQAAVSV